MVVGGYSMNDMVRPRKQSTGSGLVKVEMVEFSYDQSGGGGGGSATETRAHNGG